MARFAGMRYIDVWYAHLDVDKVYGAFAGQLTKKQRKLGERYIRKARSTDSLDAFDKLAEQSGAGVRIASQPPLIIPLRDIPRSAGPKTIDAELKAES